MMEKVLMPAYIGYCMETSDSYVSGDPTPIRSNDKISKFINKALTHRNYTSNLQCADAGSDKKYDSEY